MIQRIAPIFGTLKSYSKKKFGSDLIAGITVATVLIPQGMAYALLAGVPPIYGLYTGIFPLIIYAIFGTSRHLSIGPVAISSLLVLSGVSLIAEPGSAEFIGLVITAGFFIGLAQMLMSFLRLGFLVNFISYPVIAGFTSAAAIIILASQLKNSLGIAMPRFSSIVDYFTYTIIHIAESNWITILICGVAMLLMIVFKKIHKAIPGALIVVVLGVLVTYIFRLDKYGVEIIADIPKGFPAFEVPDLDFKTLKSLVPVILTVTIMGVVECISIAKVYEAKHGDYTVIPNQELFAIGISKTVSAFFQSIPSSGSFTRSAINSDSGGKTAISSIVTAIIISMTLLILTPLFYYLPKAILAAIILLAVFGLFDLKEAVNLWKTHKRDFIMMLVTFIATLTLGIEIGVLFGVVLSVLMVLYKSSKPHMAILGNIKGTNYYRNVIRFKEAIEFDKTLIVRFDDQIYFANSNYFKEKIRDFISEPKYQSIKNLVLDLSNVHDIDSTAIRMLKDLEEDLNTQGIDVHVCSARGPLRDSFFRNGLIFDHNHHHMDVHEAIKQIQTGEKIDKKNSIQTNVKP